MDKSLLAQAEENLNQYRKDVLIKRLENTVIDKKKYERLLALVNEEIEEINTLPLEEAYAKYGNQEGMRRY